MKRFEIFFGVIRVPIDFLVALSALFAAYFLRAQENILPSFLKQPDLGSFPAFPDYVKLSIIGAVIFIILMVMFGMYSLRVSASLGSEIRRIFTASLIWLMTAITYYFFMRQFPFSRLVLFYSFGFLVVFVSFSRILIKNLQDALVARGYGKRRIVFVGNNAIAFELRGIMEGIKSISIIGTARDFDELKALFQTKRNIEEVIQTQDDHEQAEHIIAFCRERHLLYHFVPDLLEMHKSNIEISAIGGIPLISLLPTPLDGWGKVLKRAFDIIFSALGLIILSPFFLIIAVVIKLDSRGRVFFKCLDDGAPAFRVGEHGRKFVCLKFRTMKEGTHNLRYTELADKNVRKDSPLVKIKNDPRITGVGRILRRFSLDELPQLWNVLKGEMSLVGPRPHLPEEVEKYESHHKFVLEIKPGITGMAQISGRSDLPFKDEVRLDTYYIENWSLFLDLKILLKTVFVVLKPYRE